MVVVRIKDSKGERRDGSGWGSIVMSRGRRKERSRGRSVTGQPVLITTAIDESDGPENIALPLLSLLRSIVPECLHGPINSYH